MAGYGEAGYIGGKSWPSSIMVTRKATPEQMERAGFAQGGAITAPSVTGGVDPATSAALEKAMAFYREGGGYGKGVEAGLERGRVKSLATGMQSMVSAGLAGTSMPAGLGKKYEEEVAMPARARVEETRAQAISGLETLKAQITQGATEAARARALQKYLAQLQSSTQFGVAGMRSTPSMVRTPAPTTRTKQQDTGGYGGGYGGVGETYGSIVDTAPTGPTISPETYQGASEAWRSAQEPGVAGAVESIRTKTFQQPFGAGAYA